MNFTFRILLDIEFRLSGGNDNLKDLKTFQDFNFALVLFPVQCTLKVRKFQSHAN